MKTSHTGCHSTLYKTPNWGMHTVEHVLLHCTKYNNERRHLIQSLKKEKHHDFTLSDLLGKTLSKLYDDIITFVK